MSFGRGRAMSSTGGRWRRLRRLLGLERNPLRRRTDRFQTWLRVATLVVGLVGLAVTGFAVQRTYATGSASQRETALVGYRTTGQVLSSSDPAVSPDGTIVRGTLRVAWRDHAGRQHTQLVVAPNERKARATSLPLWIDARERASAQPPHPGQSAAAATMAGILGTGLTITVAVILYMLVMLPVERRRLAEWQAEWSVVEPGWRRQVL